MLLFKLEDLVLKDLYNDLINNVLTIQQLSLFRKGSKNDIISAFDNVKLRSIINMESRMKYDLWFEEEVLKFHQEIFPLYRDTVTVSKDNPFTYSARLLTSLIKYLCLYIDKDQKKLLFGLSKVHPIITTKFLKGMPEFGFKHIYEIQSIDDYYLLVNRYRELVRKDLCKENEWLLDFKIGHDL